MKRKGVMHVLEGIIAALLILSYSSHVLNIDVQDINWKDARMKQQSREFLSVMERTNLSTLIVQTEMDKLDGLTSYFLGETTQFSIESKGLVTPVVKIGVWINESEITMVYNNSAINSCNIYTNYTKSPYKHDVVCVQNESGCSLAPDCYNCGYEKSILLTECSSVKKEYEVIDIADNGSFVMFWNASRLSGIKEKLSPSTSSGPLKTEINRRSISFDISGVSKYNELEPFDIILITSNETNDRLEMPEENELEDFLINGKSVLELVNITTIDSIQQNIFGLEKVSYSIISESGSPSENFILNNLTKNDESYTFSGYFRATEIDAVGKMESFSYTLISNTEYDCYAGGYYVGHGECTPDCNNPTSITVTGITNYGTSVNNNYCRIDNKDNKIVYVGNLTLNSNYYPLLIANHSDFYDTIYIDNNTDNNFTDNIALNITNQTSIGANTYLIYDIDSEGSFARMKMNRTQKFGTFGNFSIYSKHNDSGYILAESEHYGFNSTGNVNNGDKTTSSMSGSNNEKKGNIDFGSATYTIMSKNSTHTPYFDEVYIDFNKNSGFADDGEGAYHTGDKVRFGAEVYEVNITMSDGSQVKFSFAERWKLPAAIFNDEYNGRAIWMAPDIADDDQWALLKSILIWIAPKDQTIREEPPGYKSSVSQSAVFIVNEEMYEPYEVRIKSWY